MSRHRHRARPDRGRPPTPPQHKDSTAPSKPGKWPQLPAILGSTRGGAFLDTEMEYEGRGAPRDHYHFLAEEGIHVRTRP